MSTSGRARIEARLAKAAIRVIDTTLGIVQALEQGDSALAKRLSLKLAKDAVRNAEGLAKLQDMPERLRKFYRRQHRKAH